MFVTHNKFHLIREFELIWKFIFPLVYLKPESAATSGKWNFTLFPLQIFIITYFFHLFVEKKTNVDIYLVWSSDNDAKIFAYHKFNY